MLFTTFTCARSTFKIVLSQTAKTFLQIFFVFCKAIARLSMFYIHLTKRAFIFHMRFLETMIKMCNYFKTYLLPATKKALIKINWSPFELCNFLIIEGEQF